MVIGIIMKIKAVIFDMDGVIFDTERLYLESWFSVFKDYGYEFKKEIYFSVMGKGRKRVKEIYIENFGENLPIEEMYKKKDEILMKKIYKDKNLLKEGVLEILEYLSDNNIKIALATAAKRDRVLNHLDSYRLYDFFEVITTGEDISKGKPNPEIFLKTMKELGVTREEVMIIEDSEAGIEAAIEAAENVIHIKDLITLEDERFLGKYKAFESLREVRQALLGHLGTNEY